MKIKIAITDDHPMVRDGLLSMLRPLEHIEVVGEYVDGRQLLDGLRQKQPDVLLLDFQLPGAGGEVLVPQLRKLYPKMRIIIVTSNSSIYNIKMMLNSGVCGYLLKSTDQELLVHAIEQVYQGNSFVSPEVHNILNRLSTKVKDNIEISNGLTPREIDILRLIAEEKNSHEIAEELHLSYRTVENYRLGLMQKLEAKNMIGMVKKAIMLGIFNM